MRRYLIFWGVLAAGAAVASCSPSTATPAVATVTITPTSETVEIHWFSGLGLGSDSNQQKAQQAVVDTFNQTVGQEKNIRLILDTVNSGSARATLAARIGQGDGPDIVGPTGMVEANAFHDQWLDLAPYISAAGFDTSVFPNALMNVYRANNETTALPFMAYPMAVVYNVSLFNQYGYAYPPDRYAQGYLMPDGSEAEWTWDTLAAIARRMTVDGSGRNADDPDFTAEDIQQYGFTWQDANHPSYWGAYWSGGSMWESGRKNARTPDGWKTAWQWTYDAIWSDRPFIANASEEGSPAFGSGKPFDSGKAAMTVLPLQSIGAMESAGTWNIAVLPANNDSVSSRIEEAAFRILKDSRHPQEAFTVLQYLVTTAVDPLLIGDPEKPAAYDGVPALTDKQEAWQTAKAEIFTGISDLTIVISNLTTPAELSAEGYMPNFQEAWSRGTEFADRLRTTPDVDLDLEIKAYEDALTEIFAKPGSP
jgi:multiple sugar transport system substrate-binding protein